MLVIRGVVSWRATSRNWKGIFRNPESGNQELGIYYNCRGKHRGGISHYTVSPWWTWNGLYVGYTLNSTILYFEWYLIVSSNGRSLLLSWNSWSASRPHLMYYCQATKTSSFVTIVSRCKWSEEAIIAFEEITPGTWASYSIFWMTRLSSEWQYYNRRQTPRRGICISASMLQQSVP